MNKLNKLTLPLTILIASVVLGGFFYASQVNKQKSIEKQQQLELQEERIKEEARIEQAKKEYTADRKRDCLDIYETEGEKWNNVRGWRYDEVDDECFIRYKDPDPKSDSECDESYPVGGDSGFLFLRMRSLCKEGEFENTF